MSETPRTAFASADTLGEGPHWSVRDRRLYWVDILAPALRAADPAAPGTIRSTPLPWPCGAAVPRAGDGFVLAGAEGVATLDASGTITPLAAPEADRPGNRFNDAKCDSRGRLWAGSLAMDGAAGRGALWCVEPDGRARCAIDGVDIGNGLGWSPDDRLFYFTDSGRRRIDVHEFDAARGEIANPRPFVRLAEDEGMPDGLAIDAEGFLWCACWDGAALRRYDPDGRLERVVPLPVPRPTSCAFGGADGTTLYVTSARVGLDAATLAAAPLSGRVLALEAGVRGLSERTFGG